MCPFIILSEHSVSRGWLLPDCVLGPLADDGFPVILGLLPWPGDVASPERLAGEAG